jgi:hypothetical protein
MKCRVPRQPTNSFSAGVYLSITLDGTTFSNTLTLYYYGLSFPFFSFSFFSSSSSVAFSPFLFLTTFFSSFFDQDFLVGRVLSSSLGTIPISMPSMLKRLEIF